MKHNVGRMGIVLAVIMAAVASGCAGSAPSSPLPAATSAPTAAPEGSLDAIATPGAGVGSLVLEEALPQDYEDALSGRNQLALGTLRLAETEHQITPEQAGDLLFLWQALKSLGDSSTTASEETAAVQSQILEALTAEQVAAIAAMRLTNDDLNAFYVEQGLELTTPEPGVTPQGGRMRGLTPEEREAVKATAQAQGTPVGTGGGSGSGAARRDILLDRLIAYLDELRQ